MALIEWMTTRERVTNSDFNKLPIKMTNKNPKPAIKFCSCCLKNLSNDTGKRLRNIASGVVREFHKPCAAKTLKKLITWEEV